MSNFKLRKLTIWCICTSLFGLSTLYGFAATYTSQQNGIWNSSSTWGKTPPNLGKNDVITISAGHEVTHDGDLGDNKDNNTFHIYGTLTINGTLTVKNDLIINVHDGAVLNIDDIVAQNDATVTIYSGGTTNIINDLDFDIRASVTVQGLMDIGGNVDVGNHSALAGSGTVNVGGSCADGNSSFCSEGPLPVELLFFEAEQKGSEVSLTWSTASELNNDFFTVEKSADGQNFAVLATIEGNGTVNSTSDYQLKDADPALGISYYRLSQTDFDGTTEQFPMISVFNTSRKNSLSLYPNPICGRHVQLRSSGTPQNEPVTLRITNLQGQLIKEQTIIADAFGNIDQQIDLQTMIKKDTYIVELISRSHKDIIKVLGN